MRIIDLTENLAGPYATTILADLGWDVIKIERPEGDPMRRIGYAEDVPIARNRRFETVHRGKKSVVVDLKTERGRQLVLQLCQSADAFIQNFQPGVVQRLGVAYEDVSAVAPSVVYCSVSGFGQEGPYSQRPGVDLIAQAMAGLMSVTGESGGPPAKAGYPVIDIGTGMWAAISILHGTLARSLTGKGCHVETSLYECCAAWSMWETMDYLMTSVKPDARGSAHRFAAPYQAFRCRDGRYIALEASRQDRWEGLCIVLSVPELIAEERYSTAHKRYLNRQQLEVDLQAAFDAVDSEEAIDALLAVDVVCGPVVDIPEMLKDQHFLSRMMLMEIGGNAQGNPPSSVLRIAVSDAREGVFKPEFSAPELGQHTDEVLKEAGLADSELHWLRAQKVIA